MSVRTSVQLSSPLRHLDRDFPDSLRPAAAVGLPSDPTTDREVGKDFSWPMARLSGRLWATIAPRALWAEASLADPGRLSPSPPPSGSVSTVFAVSRAAGVLWGRMLRRVERWWHDAGWGRDAAGRRRGPHRRRWVPPPSHAHLSLVLRE